jgi:hypothetical protein
MKQSLNLMSERSRKREQVRFCLRFWSRACAAVLLIIALVGFSHWRTLRQQQQQQASAEAEYEPIRQLKLESERLSKQIASFESAERIPLALANHRPLLSLIGMATQTVAEHDGAIYLRQLEIAREPISLESNHQPRLQFNLNGHANEGSAVTQLADTLRKVGPFAEVELTSNRHTQAGAQAEQYFSIQCTN